MSQPRVAQPPPNLSGTILFASSSVKSDVYQEYSTDAAKVLFQNGGNSTASDAVEVKSVAGGVTITAALNKNITFVTSGTGVINLPVGSLSLSTLTVGTNLVLDSGTTYNGSAAKTISTSLTPSFTTVSATSTITSNGIIAGNAGDFPFSNPNADRGWTFAGTGSSYVTASVPFKTSQNVQSDTYKEYTTNAAKVSFQNSGTGSAADSVEVKSTSGGVTISMPVGKLLTVTGSGISSSAGYFYGVNNSGQFMTANASHYILYGTQTNNFPTGELTVGTNASGTRWTNTSGRTILFKAFINCYCDEQNFDGRTLGTQFNVTVDGVDKWTESIYAVNATQFNGELFFSVPNNSTFQIRFYQGANNCTLTNGNNFIRLFAERQ